MASVCDTAQSFLGLGNGPQVLHSTPNKGCSDPNDTFHPNAFTGRFSFSEVTHRLDQGTRHFFILEPLYLPSVQYQHHSPVIECLQGRG